MTTPGDPIPDAAKASGDQPELLNVVIYPHRSLGPTGFLILMGALCGCSFLIGLIFFLSGAWPVVGFLGLDVLVVYVAFRLNYRAARAFETIRLTADTLEVTQVDAGGNDRRTSFQPYWLRVELEDAPRRSSRLTLHSHGRALEIAKFLIRKEKHDLARTLREALGRVRQPSDPVGDPQ